MAGKFLIPFAENGPRRFPTPSERIGGFPCGPADAALFNSLFHSFHAELGHLIEYAGLSDDPQDLTQVRKAVQALIMIAIGAIDLGEGEGPDLSGFLLLNQARARLPVFPEVLNADNRILVTQPTGGTVLVPDSVQVSHRGIHVLNTSDFDEPTRTFATAASKTYHLRLKLSTDLEALSLNDLSNGIYNPTVANEASPIFDSTYDDMLIARVVTNGSNVATITNLRNANRLTGAGEETGPGAAFSSSGSPVGFGFEENTMPSQIVNYKTVALNWARTPRTYLSAINDILFGTYGPPSVLLHPNNGTIHEKNFGVRTLSRYALAAWAHGDTDIRLGWVANA